MPTQPPRRRVGRRPGHRGLVPRSTPSSSRTTGCDDKKGKSRGAGTPAQSLQHLSNAGTGAVLESRPKKNRLPRTRTAKAKGPEAEGGRPQRRCRLRLASNILFRHAHYRRGPRTAPSPPWTRPLSRRLQAINHPVEATEGRTIENRCRVGLKGGTAVPRPPSLSSECWSRRPTR